MLPLARDMIKNLLLSPSAETLSHRIEETFNYFTSLFLEEKTKVLSDPTYSFHRAQSIISGMFISLVPTMLPKLFYSIIIQSKITKIVKKYGFSDQEIQAMWINRPENLASQMNHMTMRISILLHKLAESDESIRVQIEELINSKDNDGVRSFIAKCASSEDETCHSFAKEWEVFMERFGRRGPMELDVATPRYENRPVLILTMAWNLDSTGYKDEEAGCREREEATKRVLEKLNWFDRWRVERKLPVAQCLMMYREHPKYMMITMMGYLRSLIIESGKRLKEKRLIDNEEDAFFLTSEEMLGYEDGTMNGSEFKRLVEERRKENESAHEKQFPRVIFGPEGVMKMVSNKTIRELDNLPLNVLKGMPTSAGVVEGRAVVATDPDTTVLTKGDILVAKATDPGWTPLFVPAAGVVIEIGGPLTHGSVVAREMGIPCVVSVMDLTKKLKTGMRIRVDGNKGTIEILE